MRKLFTILAILTMIFTSSLVMAIPVYIGDGVKFNSGPEGYGGETTQPWGTTTNTDAMDSAFGSGNWAKRGFVVESDKSYIMDETLAIAGNDLIYVDGSCQLNGVFGYFMDLNKPKLQDWVAQGGTLFINIAPLGQGYPYLGFGGVYMTYDIATSGTAVDPNHMLFDDDYGHLATGAYETGTSWSGTYFSHGYFEDYNPGGPVVTPLTPLITGNGRCVLGEKDYGLGHVMFGSMSTTNWHDPDPYAYGLRVRILNYGQNPDQEPILTQEELTPIPEPSTMLLFGTGLIGMSRIARRRFKR